MNPGVVFGLIMVWLIVGFLVMVATDAEYWSRKGEELGNLQALGVIAFFPPFAVKLIAIVAWSAIKLLFK